MTSWDELYGVVKEPALTKRELFAAMAMQGILSQPEGFRLPENVSEDAVRYADHLIKELNK